MLPLLFCALVASTPAQGWDHARLSEALERLMTTGEPRHVDHDEGQELWAALQPALARDPALRALATRAAIPLIVRVNSPLSPLDELPSLEVRAERVLPLAWRVSYTAEIEARVDRGSWRTVMEDVRSGSSTSTHLNDVVPRSALTPGVHILRLRARIRYRGDIPAGVKRVEVRELPTQSYGLWNPTRVTYPGAGVAAFVDAGRYPSVGALEAGLPDVPLALWLMQLPLESGSPVRWRTEWCSRALLFAEEQEPSNELCVVARFSSITPGNWAEVWVRIGALEGGQDGPRWTATAPALQGAFLHGPRFSQVSLAMMATLIDEDAATWPEVRLVVRASDIYAIPAVPRPGEPTTVRVPVSNSGSAPAHGVTVHILAGFNDGEPVAARTFVRDIPAGERVDIVFDVDYPVPYGWVMVRTGLLTDHAESPQTDEEHTGEMIVSKFFNREMIPPALIAALCGGPGGRTLCGG